MNPFFLHSFRQCSHPPWRALSSGSWAGGGEPSLSPSLLPRPRKCKWLHRLWPWRCWMLRFAVHEASALKQPDPDKYAGRDFSWWMSHAAQREHSAAWRSSWGRSCKQKSCRTHRCVCSINSLNSSKKPSFIFTTHIITCGCPLRFTSLFLLRMLIIASSALRMPSTLWTVDDNAPKMGCLVWSLVNSRIWCLSFPISPLQFHWYRTDRPSLWSHSAPCLTFEAPGIGMLVCVRELLMWWHWVIYIENRCF